MANIYNITSINPNHPIFGKSFVHSQSGLIFTVTKNGYEIDGNLFMEFPDLINYLAKETGIYYKTILAHFFINMEDESRFPSWFH